jgi:uncharacterized protein YbjT (DUF2867 family)
MNLTVFGATGGVGREVVTQALDAGHHVIAQVRNPARLTSAASATTDNREDKQRASEQQSPPTPGDAALIPCRIGTRIA